MKKALGFAFLLVFSVQAMAQRLTAEQQKVKKVYTDFVKWYRDHGETLDGFDLFHGSDTTENGQQPPWIMNWPNVEKYLVHIRKNVPYLGETFIANERKFLKQCEKYWKEDPKEELTAGFDYDRFLGGQESPDVLAQNILAKNVKWKVVIKGNRATIYYITPWDRDEKDRPLKITSGTKVLLQKEKGKWKIALLQNKFGN